MGTAAIAQQGLTELSNKNGQSIKINYNINEGCFYFYILKIDGHYQSTVINFIEKINELLKNNNKQNIKIFIVFNGAKTPHYHEKIKDFVKEIIINNTFWKITNLN